MTSLLRELMPVPNDPSASSTRVCRPSRASAQATARPITPAPMTSRSIFSTGHSRCSTRIVGLDPLPIAAVHDRLPPMWILEVPVEGARQSGLEHHGGLIPQFGLDLVAVDGIPTVMPGTIGHIRNQAAGTLAARGRA